MGLARGLRASLTPLLINMVCTRRDHCSAQQGSVDSTVSAAR